MNCLSVYPSECISVLPSVCPSVCLPFRPFSSYLPSRLNRPSVLTQVNLSVRPFVRLSVRTSIGSSVCTSFRLSVCLSLLPSVCQYIDSIRLSARLYLCPSVCTHQSWSLKELKTSSNLKFIGTQLASPSTADASRLSSLLFIFMIEA